MPGQLDLLDTIAAPGPQDGPWRAPPIDPGLLALLEREGRSPFGSEEHDNTQVQAMADETLVDLIVTLLDLNGLDQRHRGGRHAFRSAAQWEAFVRAYPGARQRLLDGYEATLDAVSEVWGFAGRDAFDSEARRQADSAA
jgi:hypothetical protein